MVYVCSYVCGSEENITESLVSCFQADYLSFEGFVSVADDYLIDWISFDNEGVRINSKVKVTDSIKGHLSKFLRDHYLVSFERIGNRYVFMSEWEYNDNGYSASYALVCLRANSPPRGESYCQLSEASFSEIHLDVYVNLMGDWYINRTLFPEMYIVHPSSGEGN